MTQRQCQENHSPPVDSIVMICIWGGNGQQEGDSAQGLAIDSSCSILARGCTEFYCSAELSRIRLVCSTGKMELPLVKLFVLELAVLETAVL